MNEGWEMPVNSRKFHFFREGRSLCGHWMIIRATYKPDNDPLEEQPLHFDCKTCWRKRKKELDHER